MSLLKNLQIQNWLHANPYKHLQIPLRKQAEDAWGKSISNDNSCRWPISLSKSLFKEYLIAMRSKEIICNKVYKLHDRRLKVDFETEDTIYKLHCRTWNAQSPRRNILTTPYEYYMMPKISGKPLNIILIANQERDNSEVFDA